MVAGTAVPPESASENWTVSGWMSSLNAAVTSVAVETPVALAAGDRVVTDGGVTSAAASAKTTSTQ